MFILLMICNILVVGFYVFFTIWAHKITKKIHKSNKMLLLLDMQLYQIDLALKRRNKND